MPLVRYYSALFQDQLQPPYIGDVVERIGSDHNQVGELAHLHCAQFGGSLVALDQNSTIIAVVARSTCNSPLIGGPGASTSAT
jgi:hypothetical protein